MSYQQELDTLLDKKPEAWGASDYAKLFELLKNTLSPARTNAPLLLEIHDNFGGTQNYPSLNLYVAAILGSIGYPTLVMGSQEHETEKGVQHWKVLKAAGLEEFLTIDQAISKIEDSDIGWAYMDFSTIKNEELKNILKQAEGKVSDAVIRKLESILQPIYADKQYLLSQYRLYKNRAYNAAVIKEHAKFDKALLVNGMEGSCMVNPTSPSESLLFDGDEIKDVILYGVQHGFAHVPKYILDLKPEDVVQLGNLLFDSEDVPIRRFVQYQCVFILNELFGVDVDKALYQVRQTVDSGIAKMHWERFFEVD